METLAHICSVALIVTGIVVGLAFAFDKPKGAHAFIHGAIARRPRLGHTGGEVPYLARYQAHVPFYGRHRLGHNYGI